ncbi:MAG TPA: DNA methyltransferase [Candidatus Kapabacteria bacterium]|jgi:site-specific DNA-methyltransferase (adenine-specific)|nr:DNA methyltransferase [Candidatus Kapabacteria bacterium]
MASSLNRTLQLTNEEFTAPIEALPPAPVDEITSNLYAGEVERALKVLPHNYFDLVVADPPYNYGVDFGNKSDHRSDQEYFEWVESWISKVHAVMKPQASIYICCGWEYSGFYQSTLERAGFTVLNRITWKREKGRGAKKNWKQNMEDIWFAVRDPQQYTFNIDQVKNRKKVIAPYKENGKPKDWAVDDRGEPYRMTHPSNIWIDLTVPFWSMRENTPHPTQKPEKLMERILTASSNPGDRVLDLFSGSGTTSVVAKRLHREFVGIEMNPEYIRYGLKRLQLLNQPIKI